MKLKGKVVIITGGTRGIGKGIALEFAKAGAMLVLNYLNDDDSAIETLEEIKSLGNYCSIVKGDVSDYNFSKSLIADTIDKLGKIDVLINNAAISKVGLFMDLNEKDFDEIMSINFKSVFNTTNSVVKHMISRQEGNIINISSMWGEQGASCEVIYSASKGAMNSFTKALAKELAPSNIRVNAIAPGVIETKMNNWMNEEERAELTLEIPMGRFGYVSEIGRAAVFLASEESSYITGEILNVKGGF
ncbi:MAG: SDR family oxidoreductase [Clostridium sp.]|uniref:elongation factor P 5-aminopentanone reductase n=1 Tax=Clostridium sp. TaxID=1506 RepID=UPI00306BCC39